MQDNQGLTDLIYLFSKLPGIGSRSARRIVLHLLQDKDVRLKGLITGLQLAVDKINNCRICDNLDYHDICSVCSSSSRTNDVIAIVETVAELWAIERSGVFQGKYHVLGNTASAKNRTAEALKLNNLIYRCKNANTKELIIATNATLEGQTTAFFITDYFRDTSIKITRLASGIPIGGELDYLDEGTLSAAFEKRITFD